jgi:hypothetical protein
MVERYPLQWPLARPRTKARKTGNFSRKVQQPGQSWTSTRDITLAEAVARFNDELERLGVKSYILSSNLRRNRDGSITSGQAEPADPGVAAYFTLNGKPICMPCDTYTKAAQNIAAIAKHIEATRAIERYGVASLSEMFTGFEALPAPSQQRAWWEVLGVSQWATADQINAAWREKARRAHPDGGGSDAAMSEINVARDQGLKTREAA